MKPSVTIDTRGAFCPVPVIKTSEALRSLRSGETVEVVSDDPAIEYDMPAFCRSNGHTIVSDDEAEGVFRFVVRKGKGVRS